MSNQIATLLVVLLSSAGIAAGQGPVSQNDVAPDPPHRVKEASDTIESKDDQLTAPQLMTPKPALSALSSTAQTWGDAFLSHDKTAACFNNTSCLKLPTYCYWAGVEGLYWWEKKQPIPPNFISTGSPNDTNPGALGQPNTQGLFGSKALGYGGFIGIRAFAGMWLDPYQNLGFEGSGFVLENRNAVVNFNSPAGGYPLLALRHFDVPSGPQNAFVLSAPLVPGSKEGFYSGASLFKPAASSGEPRPIFSMPCISRPSSASSAWPASATLI